MNMRWSVPKEEHKNNPTKRIPAIFTGKINFLKLEVKSKQMVVRISPTTINSGIK